MTSMRPVLRPGMRYAVDGGRAVLCDAWSVVPLSDSAARLVSAVDGVRDSDAVLAAAAIPGGDQTALRAAWAGLVERGLVVDLDRHLARLVEARRGGASDRADLAELLLVPDGDQRWQARRATAVMVHGDCDTARGVEDALVDAGVTVRPIGAPASVGLAVLAFDHEPATELTEALARDDVPHLVGGGRDSGARIGPLVVPGWSPCMRCYDLHRTSSDSTWRWRRALLSRPGTPSWRSAAPAAVRAVTVALLMAEALAFVEGRTPRTLGGTLTLTVDDLVPVHASLEPHPWCGCTWPDDTGATASFSP